MKRTHNSKGITDEQVIDCLKRGLTNKAAAKELGCCDRNYRKRRDSLIRRGLWQKGNGNDPVPDGYIVKGKSQYYDKDGKPAGVWVKSDIDRERQHELIMEAVEALTESVPARVNIKPPKPQDNDLANMFTFTDYHLAAYAWHQEGGDDWDRSIAINMLKAAMTDMLTRAPKASTAIINQLGDFQHSDGMNPVTPTSHHLLDQDGSPEQMIDASIECMDYLISEALRTHNSVKVIIAQGNHDLYSAIFLRRMYERLYRDNPRVEIVQNAVPFYALQWGRNLLGFHHGHKVKFDQLPALFANEFRHMMGDTDRTFIHMGHYHHKHVKELGKTIVEMHRTLAARDSHASYGGYHSERATDLITYHKQYGEVGRLTCTPAMLNV